MKSRVQEFFVKALEIRSRMEESFGDLYQSDGHDGFYILSSNSVSRNLSIKTFLDSQQKLNLRHGILSAEAQAICDESVAGGVVIGEARREQIVGIFKNLKEAIDLRARVFIKFAWCGPIKTLHEYVRSERHSAWCQM
jgi:hypothetical protein